MLINQEIKIYCEDKEEFIQMRSIINKFQKWGMLKDEISIIENTLDNVIEIDIEEKIKELIL